jgi:glucan 1,3-beta-glucosidase
MHLAHAGLSNRSVGLWKKNNLKATSIALRFLASYLAPIEHVVGLELLNEPKNTDRLEGWYNSTIAECRAVAGKDFPM